MNSFEYTDPSGDTLVACPTTLLDGTPILAVRITEYNDEGPANSAVVHLPTASLEKVVAGFRDMGRQADGSEPSHPSDPAASPRRIAEEAETRAQTLAGHLDLVREFRIPVKNTLGGYAELTVERGPGPFDGRWAITDGATHSKKVWIRGIWYWLSSIGPNLAYRYTMAEAIAEAEEVAALEGHAHDEHLRTIQTQQGAATGGTR